mmetsp:Transcript_67296/g.161330  ORF Transcript_67296/g.161330 Transcript_67296/m.161330 type:complete len:228 (+) Transcript_67296:52-735(+)
MQNRVLRQCNSSKWRWICSQAASVSWPQVGQLVRQAGDLVLAVVDFEARRCKLHLQVVLVPDTLSVEPLTWRGHVGAALLSEKGFKPLILCHHFLPLLPHHVQLLVLLVAKIVELVDLLLHVISLLRLVTQRYAMLLEVGNLVHRLILLLHGLSNLTLEPVRLSLEAADGALCHEILLDDHGILSFYVFELSLELLLVSHQPIPFSNELLVLCLLGSELALCLLQGL